MQWASGNQGYNLCGMATNAIQYPTSQADGGVEGKCVKLVTQSTGTFGMNTNPKMPIAAGNLFIGSFNMTYAIIAPRQATQFGFPFTRKPLKMSGYYKYKPGATLTDQNGNVISGKPIPVISMPCFMKHPTVTSRWMVTYLRKATRRQRTLFQWHV